MPRNSTKNIDIQEKCLDLILLQISGLKRELKLNPKPRPFRFLLDFRRTFLRWCDGNFDLIYSFNQCNYDIKFWLVSCLLIGQNFHHTGIQQCTEFGLNYSYTPNYCLYLAYIESSANPGDSQIDNLMKIIFVKSVSVFRP